MTQPSPTRVVFFQVNESGSKLEKLIETARTHFGKKEPFLIFVEDEKGEKYVDDLLWKIPKTGFLPHLPSDGPTNERLVITKKKCNVNNAKIAFNLCPHPLFVDPPFKIIYEFEDSTTPIKKNFSLERFEAYKRAGYFIEAR